MVYWNGMDWNGGSFKGVPVLPPPVACGKPVEAGTGLVYAVHYCNRREGKPLQYAWGLLSGWYVRVIFWNTLG